MAFESKTTNEFIEEFIENLNKHGVKWKKPWIDKDVPINGYTGNPYKGNNALNLAFCEYKDPRWFTYLQVSKYNEKNKTSAHVIKGQSPSRIVEYFSQYDKKTKKQFDDSVFDGMSAEEKKEYYAKYVTTNLSAHKVFNAEQIEGLLKYEEQAKDSKISSAIIQQLLDKPFVSSITHKGNQAYYSPHDDAIVLPKFDCFISEEGYNATFLHELSHSTGHDSRLNRGLNSSFGTQNYAKEELVAEISSMLLELQLGLHFKEEHIENHQAYVASWLRAIADDKNYISDAVIDAKKAAKYVLDYYKEKINIETPLEELESSKDAYNKAHNIKEVLTLHPISSFEAVSNILNSPKKVEFQKQIENVNLSSEQYTKLLNTLIYFTGGNVKMIKSILTTATEDKTSNASLEVNLHKLINDKEQLKPLQKGKYKAKIKQKGEVQEK